MRLVITGAAGKIGAQLIKEFSSQHELRLIDRTALPGRFTTVADLSVSEELKAGFFNDCDVVVHLAADAHNLAAWDSVLNDNVKATWNVLEAAARAKVGRVVFSSSNWAVKARERALAPACYTDTGSKIGSDDGPQPLNPYGLSKAFGELAGRMFVDNRQLRSFVAVRIGYYNARAPRDANLRRLWIGSADLRALFRRCVEAEFEGFHVIYGVSAQAEAPYDLSHSCSLLSWQPRQLP
jgi:nucleoside-diphosphate-sugar epimerase